MIDKVPPPCTAPPLMCSGPAGVLDEPGFALELPRNFTSSEVDELPLWPIGWTWSLFPNRTKLPLWRSPDLPATRMKQHRLVALWFLRSPGAKKEEGHMHPTPNFHALLQLPLWEGTWLLRGHPGILRVHLLVLQEWYATPLWLSLTLPAADPHWSS